MRDMVLKLMDIFISVTGTWETFSGNEIYCIWYSKSLVCSNVTLKSRYDETTLLN